MVPVPPLSLPGEAAPATVQCDFVSPPTLGTDDVAAGTMATEEEAIDMQAPFTSVHMPSGPAVAQAQLGLQIQQPLQPVAEIDAVKALLEIERLLSTCKSPSLLLLIVGNAFCNSSRFQPAGGTRGGLILAVSSDFFSIDSHSTTLNTISVNLTMRATGACWSPTTVYGPQSDQDKMMFINEIKDLKSVVLPQWFLIGDFNLLYRASDKSNHNINRRLLNSFRAAVNLLELSELRLHGRRFTWISTCQQQTRTKIDHAFFSADWNVMFSQCHLAAITSSMSDHCAFLLIGQVIHRRFRGIRFENYWLSLCGFQEPVSTNWALPVINRDAMRVLHIKLSRLGKALRLWSRVRIRNIRLLCTTMHKTSGF
jgi:hypothetical protein